MALGHAVFFNVDVSINQDLKAVYPINELRKHFLFYWFQSKKKYIARLGSGSTVDGISQDELKNIDFSLPPLSEQEKIVEALETWDEYLEKLTEAIKLKKKVKNGLMQALLSGKTRLAGFSEKWKIVKLEEILKIGNGKDYKHLSPGAIPVFGTGGLMLHVDKPLYSGKTVFIGRKGTIDKPFFYNGPFWTVDTLFYTHSFKNTLPEFVHILFQKIDWKIYNEASGVPSLSKKNIEKIEIHLPPLPEQTAIAQILTTADQEIEALEKKKELVENQKKFLLKNLITGKIRLPEFTDHFVDVNKMIQMPKEAKI